MRFKFPRFFYIFSVYHLFKTLSLNVTHSHFASLGTIILSLLVSIPSQSCLCKGIGIGEGLTAVWWPLVSSLPAPHVITKAISTSFQCMRCPNNALTASTSSYLLSPPATAFFISDVSALTCWLEPPFLLFSPILSAFQPSAHLYEPCHSWRTNALCVYNVHLRVKEHSFVPFSPWR